MPNIDTTEVAKFAAIVAATITVIFNAILYFLKEFIEHKRRRNSAARQLVLVGYAIWESFRSDVNSTVFSDWYKLVALSETLADHKIALTLVVEILRVHSIFREPSANLRNGRDHREAELTALKEKTISLCGNFSIASPWRS